ncbi:MAG TPA: WxL domain-containing protein [Gaiellaceae bacterium]|nr:WxL domain-containing protein [Gaiellaceae bacterium]
MRRLSGILGALIVAAVLAAGASAGDVNIALTLTGGGALSLAHESAAAFETTLDGTDRTVSYTIPLTVTDNRPGQGAGWNLTITSTTFVDADGAALATGASRITSSTASCPGHAKCRLPRNTVSYPLGVPAGTTPPAAVKFFNARAKSGTGTVVVAPQIAVTVPGNSFAGTYESTVVIAINSGP